MLNKNIPTETLFYLPVLISVFGAALIQLGFQLFFFINVQKQPWYKPPWNVGGSGIANDNWVSYEDTVLFQISNFQYLATCCAFLVSFPFRRPFYTNAWFTTSAVLILIVNVIFVVFPYSFWLCHFFDNLDFGDKMYSYKVAAAIILNSIITFVAEKVIAVPFTAWYDRRMQK